MGSRICPAAFCSLWTSVILVRLLARFFGIPDLISLLYVSLFPMHSFNDPRLVAVLLSSQDLS